MLFQLLLAATIFFSQSWYLHFVEGEICVANSVTGIRDESKAIHVNLSFMKELYKSQLG